MIHISLSQSIGSYQYAMSEFHKVGNHLATSRHRGSKVLRNFLAQSRIRSTDSQAPRILCQEMAKIDLLPEQVNIENYIEVKEGEYVAYSFDRNASEEGKEARLLLEALTADTLRRANSLIQNIDFIKNIQEPMDYWLKTGLNSRF